MTPSSLTEKEASTQSPLASVKSTMKANFTLSLDRISASLALSGLHCSCKRVPLKLERPLPPSTRKPSSLPATVHRWSQRTSRRSVNRPRRNSDVTRKTSSSWHCSALSWAAQRRRRKRSFGTSAALVRLRVHWHCSEAGPESI